MAGMLSYEDCLNILAKLFPRHSEVVRVKDFRVVPLLEKSMGFFGVHSRLQISFCFEEGKEGNITQTLVLFLKALPHIPAHQQYLDETGAFKKEVNSFKILLPSMQELSKTYGRNWAPMCWFVKSDLLVFENLAESGFRNSNGLLDRSHLIAAAKCLGHFHSSSFVFESRAVLVDANFKMSDHFGHCLFESLYIEDKRNIRYEWFNSGVNTVIKMIRIMSKYNAGTIAKIETRIPLMLSAIKRSFAPESTMTNVVCHGDLWTNNLMFRYDSDRELLECRLVDFQIVRYAPNTLDLTCMLFLCADRETRERNLSEVLKSYVDAFNSQLILAGCTSGQTTVDKILKEYEGFRMAALMEACLFEMVTRLDEGTSEAMLASPIDVEEFFYGDRDKFVISAFERDVGYRTRMTELIVEFVDNHVLVE